MHLSAMEELPGKVEEHARLIGFSQTAIYVTDLQQLQLIPLPGQQDVDGEPLEPMRIDGTLPGRAFRMMDIVRARVLPVSAPQEEMPREGAEEEQRRLWVPLLDGTERVGVLGVTV